MNLGMMELMVFMFANAGLGADLATIIDAEAYFKSRNLPMTIEKKIELAGTDPKTGAAQTQQLLSLRWFSENAGKVNESNKKAEILKLLQQIAAGKKANDDLGFAKEYAQAALLRLQGKKIEYPPPPDNSVRRDALKWFPASANLIGAIDLRNATDSAASNIFDSPLIGQIPDEFRKKMFHQIFDAADEIGNMRIARVSFAYSEDLQNKNESRIFFRITGKVDHQRYVHFLKNIGQGMVKIQSRKDLKGTPITLIQFGNNPPASALVGNTDMIIGGFQGTQGNHLQIVEEVLTVRAGRQGSVTTGAMQQHLAKISKHATGVAIGNVPAAMGMMGRGVPMPYFAILEMRPDGKNQLLSFDLKMKNAGDAKMLRKLMLDGRDEALKQMKNVPAIVPAKMIENLKTTLKSLKMEAKGSDLSGSIRFRPSVLISVPFLMLSGL